MVLFGSTRKRALEYDCPLPTAFANGIDLYLASSLDYYRKIAGELDTSARIAALLGNLGILFAAGKIDVESELTETLKRFVDVVPAKEANLEGYGIETVYKLKPEFEKYFEMSLIGIYQSLQRNSRKNCYLRRK